MEDILLPLRFPFMQSAFLMAALVAMPTALLSCFVVLRGWALMGDAISHAVLPGIVIAYMTGLPLVAGAFAAGMGTALATGYLSANSRVKPDTVMGVVFSGMFGFGIVLYVWAAPEAHLDHILFGNLLGVEPGELVTTACIALPVAVLILAKWRDLLVLSFDPAQARASGLAVAWLHYGLLAALSLTIVATLTAAGLVLAVGLLIAPGATAFLLTRRFGHMLWVATLVNLAALLAGTYASFFLDSSPAATIILVLTALFLAALARRILVQRRSEPSP